MNKIVLFFFITNLALAETNEQIIPDIKLNLTESKNITAQEMFARTQAVLKYYQVPSEVDPRPDLINLDYLTKESEIQNLLKWMDPLNYFSHLSSIENNKLFVFEDKDSKKTLDFSIQLKAENESQKLLFKNGELYSTKRPLEGVRIAIDPGHMGGIFWDNETGKYTKDSKGRIISEGLIALQTSLLLKNDFENLGAVVFLTRDKLQPVSEINYKSFDLKSFAQAELRDSIHTNWFQNLIQKAPAGPYLYKIFDQSFEIKKLFSESSRSDFFIKRVDLQARAEKINAFKPDLVLIIHFDTATTSDQETGVNPNAPRQTKAFVFGSYEQSEFGSREARKNFARHVVNQETFHKSVLLSRAIVHQLHAQLNLELDSSTGTGTKLVEPGVISRNLLVPRLLTAPAVSYLECLFYNRPDEFESLLQTKYNMIIDGQNSPYSERLIQVSKAIRDGVLAFYQTN